MPETKGIAIARLIAMRSDGVVIKETISKVGGARFAVHPVALLKVSVVTWQVSYQFASGTHGSGEKVAEGTWRENRGLILETSLKICDGGKGLRNKVGVGIKDVNDVGEERDLVFLVFIGIERHLEELKVGGHVFHVRGADYVSGIVETVLEGLCGVSFVFHVVFSVLVKEVWHVAVGLVKRTFDTGMESKKFEVSTDKFNAVKCFRGSFLSFCEPLVWGAIVVVVLLGFAGVV